MRQKLAAISLAASAAMFGTGCASLKYAPAEPMPMPKAAGAPLPLVVAVAHNPKFGEADPLDVNGRKIPVDPSKTLAESLRASGLFREVRVPLAGDPGESAGADLIVTSDYDLKYVIDPGMMGGVLASMLILPAPFVTFTDTYSGEATLNVQDSSGRTLKQYVEKAKVEPTYQMFSEVTADTNSYPKLVNDLIAKLVGDLVRDRAFFQRAPQAPAQPAAADATATSGAQPAWWK